MVRPCWIRHKNPYIGIGQPGQLKCLTHRTSAAGAGGGPAPAGEPGGPAAHDGLLGGAAARGGGGGGGGSTDTPGDERSGLVGYGAVYQGALRRLLASEDYATAEAAVTAALDGNDYGEAITIIFSSGFLPLIHALIGYRRSLPGNPLVDRIAEELRPLGPQWVSDTLGKALLPEPTAPHKRKRLNAMPLVWLLLCKFQMDNIPWEDICYAIIAEGNGRAHPPKILPAARFTSVARLREIEGGIVALLEAFGLSLIHI